MGDIFMRFLKQDPLLIYFAEMFFPRLLADYGSMDITLAPNSYYDNYTWLECIFIRFYTFATYILSNDELFSSHQFLD